MSITYKLYDTNLLWSTYLKIIDLKVQYCKGREFLLLVPIVYGHMSFSTVDLRDYLVPGLLMALM